MLRFKIDENLPKEIATMLVAAGYDAVTVPDQQLGDHPDPDVASICQVEGRAIVTLDLDFSDIRVFPPGDYAGIVVFRLVRLDKKHILAAAQRLLTLFETETLAGKLWIVDEASVRIRG